MDGKSLLKSKTFWFNALFVLVAAASLFGYQDFKPSSQLVEVVSGLVAVANLFLRMQTKEPITKVL